MYERELTTILAGMRTEFAKGIRAEQYKTPGGLLHEVLDGPVAGFEKILIALNKDIESIKDDLRLLKDKK